MTSAHDDYHENHRAIWPELYDPNFPCQYAVVKMDLNATTLERAPLPYQYHDGGRKAAGFQGSARDCVVRSIAIAAQLPYKQVYEALADATADQRASTRTPKRKRSADHGINTQRKWFKDYMRSLGFTWVALMHVGDKRRVRLAKDALPSGPLVVALRKHYTAVINGVIYDTHNCSPQGKRCVLGYWQKGR